MCWCSWEDLSLTLSSEITGTVAACGPVKPTDIIYDVLTSWQLGTHASQNKKLLVICIKYSFSYSKFSMLIPLAVKVMEAQKQVGLQLIIIIF